MPKLSSPRAAAVVSAVVAVVLGALGGCLGPNAEAVATCDEFVGRIADHMTDCGFDGDALSEQLRDDGLDCDQAVAVEGDPLACAADFEDIACAELDEAAVNDTIGACDGEILVRRTDDG